MDYISFCKNYFSATGIPINFLDGKKLLYSSICDVTGCPQYNDLSVPDELSGCPVSVIMTLPLNMGSCG